MTGALGVVVVGNGPAAVRLTHALQQRGFHGPVTVIGRRRAAQRALVASIVDGRLAADSLDLPEHPDSVQVRLGETAVRIDRRRRLVHTDRGGYPYEVLVLATGSRPRLPDLPGLLDPGGRLCHGATTLRTAEDAARIAGDHIVVLGAGRRGVEAALALRRGGHDVTVICSGNHPLARHLDPVAGRLLADHLEARGIALEPRRTATEYTPGKVTLDDGRVIDADTLVVCCGDVPRTRLAVDAGLPADGGVLVDADLRTADPHIYAIGECAAYRAPAPVTGPVAPDALAARLSGDPPPSWPASQARIRLCDPDVDVAAYGSLADLDAAAEQVTLTDPARRRYARLGLRDQRIVAAVLIGLPHAIAAVGWLRQQGRPVPTDRLALLLETVPRPAAPAGPSDADIVCRCNQVTRRALVRAWRAGARDVSGLAEATRATTGCRGCVQDVVGLCSSLAGRPR